MKTRTYVIAHYNEELAPLTHVSPRDIIHKGLDIPNLGREASSWLLWILNHYEKLPDFITFLQGNPFDHTTLEEITTDPELPYQRHGLLLTCDLNGNPHHGTLNMRNALNIMGIPHPDPIPFCMGAQFTVSKEQILKYPYHRYANLFAYSVTNENAPWELERLWETFFA